MQKSLLAVLGIACFVSTARADLSIVGGTHAIYPNAIQTINIYAQGDGEEVYNTNLYFQMGDGTEAYPEILDLDIIGPGTLFADNHYEPYYYNMPNGRIWTGQTLTADSSIFVSGTRLLAVLKVDTLGIGAGQPFTLMLSHLLPDLFPPDGMSSDFGETPCTVFDGTITVAPAIDWRGGDAAGATMWTVAANWSPNSGVPGGAGATVRFGAQDAANSLVELAAGGNTVGNITFASTTNTTLQGSAADALTLDNNGLASTIVVEGEHQVNASLILGNDARIVGGGTLNVDGSIAGPYTLSVTGTLSARSIDVSTLVIGTPASPDALGSNAVPEPSALAILAIAAATVWLWKRRAA
jgi:hypothetical protein